MKYHNFKRVNLGESFLIRITYKTWYGKFFTKDACKSSHLKDTWVYMDGSGIVPNDTPLNRFAESGEKFYLVNGSKFI
jgi:hypothetical protein